ncbi:MAG: glycosyltransferase, partial [Nitrososphaeraceae archaeon]
ILEGRPVKFILRGAGTSTNDIQNLKNMIQQLGVKNVELRTNRLSAEELVDLLGKADIFVLPMSFVGFDLGLPTKVLEYQALGKPILCISNGEAADYVYRTDSGLVSRDKDPQKIADLIMQLAERKDLADRLGSNGYNYVQQNLTLQKIGERFMKVIKMRSRAPFTVS